jgi:cell division protein FtsL
MAGNMLPLTEEEKGKLWLEEYYRAELRRRFAEPRPNQLWLFVNSPFGLFLFSSILISLIGALYAQREHRHDIEERRNARIGRLDMEISYRLSSLLVELKTLAKEQAQARYLLGRMGLDPVAMAKSEGDLVEKARIANLHVLEHLWRPPAADGMSLYPEYAQRTPLVLMAELRDELPESHERAEIERVLSVISRREAPDDIHRPAVVAGFILRNVSVGRWRRVFPLTDCTPEQPFCY